MNFFLNSLKDLCRKRFPHLRKIWYFFRYLFIKKEFCPFCGKRVPMVSGGMPFPRKHAKCVFCGSLERHRFLFYIYEVLLLSTERPRKVLHFAPEKPIYDLLKHARGIDYICGDIRPEAYPWLPGCRKLDALATGFPSGTFDVILANHLIEHIDEDLFLQELHRILKPGGIALISAPVYMDQEMTLENPEYDTPELRRRFYGHPRHLRKYGRDAAERFARFFEVNFISWDMLPPFGDARNSNCFILRKTESAKDRLTNPFSGRCHGSEGLPEKTSATRNPIPASRSAR